MIRKLFFIFILFLTSAINVSAEEYKDAPKFRLDQYKGKSVSFTDLNAKGSIVILSFFDTKCEPCIKELPNMKGLYKKYIADPKVKIRTISLDENEDLVHGFIKKYDLTIPVLKDPGGWKAGMSYGVVKSGRAEIPQIFVIGKNGRIRFHYKGLKENIDKILSRNISTLKKEKIAKSTSGRKLDIVYTNSANGFLESCDCPENPFGGLVRRMTVIKNIRSKSSHMLLLDSGDNFPVRENKLLAEYVLKFMKLMEYDGVAIGDQELLFGTDFLKNILKS